MHVHQKISTVPHTVHQKTSLHTRTGRHLTKYYTVLHAPHRRQLGLLEQSAVLGTPTSLSPNAGPRVGPSKVMVSAIHGKHSQMTSSGAVEAHTSGRRK